MVRVMKTYLLHLEHLVERQVAEEALVALEVWVACLDSHSSQRMVQAVVSNSSHSQLVEGSLTSNRRNDCSISNVITLNNFKFNINSKMN